MKAQIKANYDSVNEIRERKMPNYLKRYGWGCGFGHIASQLLYRRFKGKFLDQAMEY